MAVALVAFAPRTVFADETVCPSHAERVVKLVGCERESCDAYRPLMRMLEELRAPTVTPAALARTEGRLVASRLVVAATAVCDPDSGDVTVTVTPATFIRRVDISGQEAFRRKDLMKRIFLRSGTAIALEGDDLATAITNNAQVQRQLESLLRLYEQAGLDDTQIDVRATRHSPTRIDLGFRIREGLRQRLDTVMATHVHNGGDDPRCPTISDTRLERLIGLGAGDLLTRNTERQLRTRLRKVFQAHGFENPQIRIAIRNAQPDDPPILDVRVETERCWLIRLWSRETAQGAVVDALPWEWQDPVGSETRDVLARGDAAYVRERHADWEAALPFGESGSFDRGEAARALEALTREHRARGHPFAEVRVIHRERSAVAANGAQEGSDVRGTIDYLMTRNLRRRIQRIAFEGVDKDAVDILSGIVRTRPYGFFSGPGTFDEARLLGDLDLIAAHYRNEGHFRLRFPDGAGDTGRAEQEDGGLVRESLSDSGAPNGPRVWRYRAGSRGFRVVMAPHERDLEVVVGLEPGLPLRVDEVQFVGVATMSPAEAETLVGIRPGEPFRPRLLDAGMQRLERAYRQRGHYRLQLKASCAAPADAPDALPAGSVDCRDPSLAALEHVVVRIEVDEGPPVRIGAVAWRGQMRTSPHVLTRDLPKGGELLDLDRVNQGLRLMRGLPVFSAVRVDIVAQENAGAPVEVADLVVAVEESETRFLDIAAGLRSIQRANIGRIPRWAANGAGLLVDQTDRLTNGFGRPFALDLPDILLTLEAEYLDLHVNGDGGQLRIPFIAGFSLSEFLRLASFNPSYSWRRFLDTRMTLTLRGIAELDRVTDPLDRLELGAEGDLLVPIGTRTLAGFTLRGGIIRLAVPDQPCINCLTAPPFGFGTALPQSLSEDATRSGLCAGDSADPACSDLGFRPQFTLGARWRHDTLDTPLHPTRGFMVQAATSFILDRDRFALQPTFNQFFKWEASLRGAIPLGDLILAGFIRYGGSVTFDQDFLPPDERFTLGGFNGLRGFSDNGICRYDRNGALEPDCPAEFGGNVIINGSVELRAPLLDAIGLWLGIFVDFGALARSHDRLYPSSFRASTGLGVRWLLGDLIPVRVDVGFPLFQRRCIAPGDGSCTLEEPSAFHVDLLYPF
jgi:outer membrane protein assembly factor BamA